MSNRVYQETESLENSAQTFVNPVGMSRFYFELQCSHLPTPVEPKGSADPGLKALLWENPPLLTLDLSSFKLSFGQLRYFNSTKT